MADTPNKDVPPPPSPPSPETDPVAEDTPTSDEKTAAEPRPETTASTTITSPHPPGSSASGLESIADSIETVTPTLGGSTQTQVNVVNRGFTPRPSTADKPNTHQFYANLPLKRHGATDIDNESLMTRSTAQRTNVTVGGSRRTPSRSHIPAIMPAYSFYHPLKPPAVANASGQQQIPQTKQDEESGVRPGTSPTTSQQTDEVSSMRGKPSTEPLLPKPAVVKTEPRVLHPVSEIASNRTSMHSSQLLGANAPVLLPPTTLHEKNGPPKTRNYQHFPGNTKYHLHGRVQFGTQYLANIATVTLILIPTGLYFTFTYSPQSAE